MMSRENVTNTLIHGFAIYENHMLKEQIGGNLQQNEENIFISALFLCDLCTNKHESRDNCMCIQKAINFSQNTSQLVRQSESACFLLFFQNRQKSCSVYAFESDLNNKGLHNFSNQEHFICESNTKIVITFVDDLVVDCPKTNDETFLNSLLQKNNFYPSLYDYQIPCRPGHPKCFNITSICIHMLNEFQLPIPCRTGEHLQHCKTFECDTHMKCSESYCVPWKYICDGKWDCSGGTDEGRKGQCKSTWLCKQLFRCKDSNMCIHIAELCDRSPDCPLGDDEYFCSLHRTTCPPGCKCVTHAVLCYDMYLDQKMLANIVPYKVIFLVNNNASFDNSHRLKTVVFITITRVKIDFSSRLLNDVNYLIVASLRNNCIQDIPTDTFSSGNSLKSLEITDNLLSTVGPLTFISSNNLLYLNLSNNPLVSLDISFFVSLANLDVLSILLPQKRQEIFHRSHKVNVRIFESGDHNLCLQ